MRPDFWDEQASDIEAAKQCVWAVPAGMDWQQSTDRCIQILEDFREDHHRTTLDFAGAMLDVGCGVGRLTIPMAKLHPGWDIWGLDVSSKMLELADIERGKLAIPNINWAHGDTASLVPASIDFAWSVVVLQHNHPDVCKPLVASVAAALNPGGLFVYQVIENIDFTDWGHLPEAIPKAWATDAGLEIVDELRGDLFPDWLWIAARKPA